MLSDRSKWRARIATAYGQLRQHFISTVFSGILLGIILIFKEFFEPFSVWFWLALAWTVLALILIEAKRYFASLLVLLAFFVGIIVLSFTASYQIASDQFRLRYRTVEGTSYLEFPGQINFLTSIAYWWGAKRLITIVACDDTKVAVLPNLPYKPLFLSNDRVNTLGFRRLPNLLLENVTLRIKASVDFRASSNDSPRRSFGVEFEFSADDEATIPVTTIFPRSMRCTRGNVLPLLPILEVLPWMPDAADSLIEAIKKVEMLRNRYPDHAISLDDLTRIHLPNNDSYSALLDFVSYSLMYQMFDGNVLSEMRANIGNKLCMIVDSHPNAFSGPFEALSENFIRRFVAELKSKIWQVATACNVSGSLVLAYDALTSPDQLLPFEVTFKKCLDSTGSMRERLKKDDPSGRQTVCDRPSCAWPSQQMLPHEIQLEDYDQKFFSSEVETKQNKLVNINSIKPSACPDLRDHWEDQHFVDWWIDHANQIIKEPMQCSSSNWRADLDRSREELHDALACAAKRGIHGARYQEAGMSALDSLYWAKCSGTLDYDRLSLSRHMVQFADQIDSIASKLSQHSDVFGDAQGRALLKAFQFFAALKRDVCGTRNVDDCVEQYRVWQDSWRFASKLTDALGLSDVGSDEKKMIDKLTKLDNIIFEMAICDALQDKEFSDRSGYERNSYCDSHGLAEYRVIGTEPVVHSTRREGNQNDAGLDYIFESNGAERKFEIRKFLKN